MYISYGNFHQHLQTIIYSGVWSHLKRHLNAPGGTRSVEIEDRINEWQFKRDFLRKDTHDLNFWKMLRVIATCGYEAKILVDAQEEENVIGGQDMYILE